MPETFDMPSWRGDDGTIYVWDAATKSYTATTQDQVSDRGHASGGDNDLFSPNQWEHHEQTGNPLGEGAYAHVKQASTDFVPERTDITPQELLSAVADEGWTINERDDKGNINENSFAIVDEAGAHLWVDVYNGIVVGFSRYGLNDVGEIIDGLQEAFGPIYSEHEDEYWDHEWNRLSPEEELEQRRDEGEPEAMSEEWPDTPPEDWTKESAGPGPDDNEYMIVYELAEELAAYWDQAPGISAWEHKLMELIGRVAEDDDEIYDELEELVLVQLDKTRPDIMEAFHGTQIRQHNEGPPEEAADQWPDTFPEHWSKIIAAWRKEGATNPINYEFIPLTDFELGMWNNLSRQDRQIWHDRAKNLNRRAIKWDETGRVNGRELHAIAQRYENNCAYCDKTLAWGGGGTGQERNHPQLQDADNAGTIDHNVSLSQGGAGTIENMLPACWQCNKDLNQWDRRDNPPTPRPEQMEPNPLAFDPATAGVLVDDVWGDLEDEGMPQKTEPVRCPNCGSEAETDVCPTCGKGLGPEWGKADQKTLPSEIPPQGEFASEFYSLPDRVPKRQQMAPNRTDDSYPSMISKVATEGRQAKVWLFGIYDSRGGTMAIEAPHQMAAMQVFLRETGMDVNEGVGGVGDDRAAMQELRQMDIFPSIEEVIEEGAGLAMSHGATRAQDGSFTLVGPLPGEPADLEWQLNGMVDVVRDGTLVYHPADSPEAQEKAQTEQWPEGMGGYGWNAEKGHYVMVNGELSTDPAHLETMRQHEEAQDAYIRWDDDAFAFLFYPWQGGADEAPNTVPGDWQGEPTPTGPMALANVLKDSMEPSLDECPECGGPLFERNQEKQCSECGHRQPILQTRLAQWQALLPLLMGGGEAAGAEAVGGEAVGGMGGMGSLMSGALGPGKAGPAGENPQAQGMNDAASNAVPLLAPGVVANAESWEHGGEDDAQLGLATTGDLIRELGARSEVSEIAGEQWPGYRTVDSHESWEHVGYDADLAGAVARGWTHPENEQKEMDSDLALAITDEVEKVAAFGEEEVGQATKNRGTNSTDEASSGGIAGKEEQGDGPEQLKDVGDGSVKTSPDEATPQAEQHGILQDTALKALEANMPLVIEFSTSEQAGIDHPILKALDELLEEAFPGYKNPQEDKTEVGPEQHPEEKEIESHRFVTEDEARAAGKVAVLTTDPTMTQGTMGEPPIPAGVGTCPMCGQNHAQGTPCPTNPNSALQPGATGQQIIPMQQRVSPAAPQTVVTHKEAALPTHDDELELQAERNQPDEHTHDHHDTGWYEDWQPEEDPKHPWIDDQGKALEQGQEYELHSTDYAIPDKITVETVTPAKLTFILHSGDVDYRDELSPEEIQTYGYTFTQPEQALDSESGFPAADRALGQKAQHADYPRNQDSVNQVDDLSGKTGASWGEEEDRRVDDVGRSPDRRMAPQDLRTCPACLQGLGWDGVTPHAPGCPEEVPDTTGFKEGRVSAEDFMDTPSNQLPNCQYCQRSPFEHDAAGNCPDGRGTNFYGGGYPVESEPPETYPTRDEPVFRPNRMTRDEVIQYQGGEGLPPGQFYPPGDPRRHQGAEEEPVFRVNREPSDLDAYTGSFEGDDPSARSWLSGESSPVEVDPVLMEKFAGKDFSAREQRQFIDESGEARNLHRLDLEGTHYIDEDSYGDTLW